MDFQFKPVITLLLIGISFAKAQKLPSVQSTPFRAPDNIKVDGKANDWNQTFQAHNNAVDLFYTIANDDNNLYLVARATQQEVINRVANGGLSLVIYKSGKKNTKDQIAITYPLHPPKQSMYFNFRGRKGSVPDTSFRAVDSAMRSSNNKLDKNVRFIAVEGIPGLDTLSIYNDNEIKVAGRFDLKLAYTIEIAIPLKILGLSVNDATKFTYQLVVNRSGKANTATFGQMTNIDGSPVSAEIQANFAAAAARAQAVVNATTDCWGEYTLAKNKTNIMMKLNLITGALLLVAADINAQKLPSVQKNTVFAPVDAKADGKPFEWANFEAYNRNTDTYYTIANDDNNLYLVVQAIEPDVIDKILMGGVTFAIKPVKSKEEKVTITYGKVKIVAGMSTGDKLKNKKEMDEAYLVLLNRLASSSKEIFITGVKAFPDSVISAYNEDGVHAAATIGMNKAYTWELSINLKYLPKAILDQQKFDYDIILNGWEPGYSAKMIEAHPNGIIAKAAARTSTDPVLMALSSPTNFSGSYKLAKNKLP